MTGLFDVTTPVVSYDRFGSPASLAIETGLAANPPVKNLVTGVSKDVFGRLTARMYANGVTRAIQYDDRWQAPGAVGAYYMGMLSVWLTRSPDRPQLAGVCWL